VAVNGRLVTSSPAGELLARLEEPHVAAALNTLLDHADLLALLVTGLDGFLSRGGVIADSLASGFNELRGAGAGAALPPIDFGGLATSLATLSGTAAGATPALTTFLDSLGDPRLIAVITQLTTALVEGREHAEANGPASVFGLLRALKDDEAARGAGFLIQVAKSLGRQLAAPAA